MSINALIKLIELRTLVAGIVPVVLGSIFSWYAFGQINLVYFILLVIAMILIQSSTNMINDYFDFKRGIDSKKRQEEKVLLSGEIKPKKVLFILYLFIFIAIIIGIYISSQTSYLILLIGIIGNIISILYSCGPVPISYTPIGEIVSGVTMGFGITTTVIYIHSGVFNLDTILVSLPTTIFIGTILLSNNLCDSKLDREAGKKTLPILIGIKKAEKLWVLNVIMLLVLTFVITLMGVYPTVLLVIVFILFPYRSILVFLSYQKSIYTKDKTMGLISRVGLKYHLAVITGLLISIILKVGI